MDTNASRLIPIPNDPNGSQWLIMDPHESQWILVAPNGS